MPIPAWVVYVWGAIGVIVLLAMFIPIAVFVRVATPDIVKMLRHEWRHFRTRDVEPRVGQVWVLSTGNRMHITRVDAESAYLTGAYAAMGLRIEHNEWRRWVRERRAYLAEVQPPREVEAADVELPVPSRPTTTPRLTVEP